MKKTFTFFVLTLMAFSKAFSQETVTATWISGDQSVNQPGNYGTKGVASPFNKPGARASAVTWTDASGNLWLMGGYGYSGSSRGALNDLWKFDTASREWTWVSGDSLPEQKGIYGTKAVSSAFNKPGARYDAVAWKDASGNLWLFGGHGVGSTGSQELSDLWKYNPSNNEWTWMGGDNDGNNQQAVYGVKGVSSTSNFPGKRTYAVGWTDLSGNMWLFGGVGLTSGGAGRLNDLWKFNPLSNEWTWVSGDPLPGQAGIYGVKGVGNAANKPGARTDAVGWVDSAGDLWLMGGYNKQDSPNVSIRFNDLWKYTLSTNQWTWVSGDSTFNQAGIYGTKGIGSVSNKPGARMDAVSWTDGSGKLWLFGGSGAGDLNDLWNYNPSTHEWTWVSGDNISNRAGIYGTKGVDDITNKPGGRSKAAGWAGGATSLWLMGGLGYASASTDGSLNDLWKYSLAPCICTTLPVTFTSFNSQCAGEDVQLTWETAQECNSRKFDVERSTEGAGWQVIGSVEAAGNSHSKRSYSFTDADPAATNNQYRIAQYDTDGSRKHTAVINSSCSLQEGFLVLPTLVSGMTVIRITSLQTTPVSLRLFNSAGSLVRVMQGTLHFGTSQLQLDMTNFASGAYILTATWGNSVKHTRLVKM